MAKPSHEHVIRQIFEASLDPITIRDLESGAYLEVNASFLDLVGYPLEELIGHTPEELGLLSTPEGESVVGEEIGLLGFAPSREVRLRTKQGEERNVLLSAVRIEVEGRSCILSFLRDVTDHRQAEEDLRRAVARIFANISHEIRTPLNVILGYGHLLGEHLESKGDTSQRDILDSVERAGARLTHTIHELLDLAKVETRTFQPNPVVLDPALVLRHVAADLGPRAEARQLGFSCRVETGEWCVRFDEYCLRNALTNLIENAIKFTEQGVITVRLYADKGRVQVEVSDTGIGMEPRYVERLREPFLQEDEGHTRRYDGTGIGLALTHRFLEMNGAHLAVDSRKGKGTVFRIDLGEAIAPAPVAARRPVASAPRRATVRRTSVPRILVVEDDPETQRMMRSLLARRYRTLTADNAEKALRVLKRTGEIDLVLTDIALPGGEDGLQLTRRLRLDERYKKTPVIAVTGYARTHPSAEATDAGCNAWLQKPVNGPELLRRIDELLESGARRAG